MLFVAGVIMLPAASSFPLRAMAGELHLNMSLRAATTGFQPRTVSCTSIASNTERTFLTPKLDLPFALSKGLTNSGRIQFFLCGNRDCIVLSVEQMGEVVEAWGDFRRI